MTKIEVEIKGVSGLLHHKFEMEPNGLETTKKKKKIYVPEEEAEKYLYKHNGIVCQPTEHILGAMTKAGSQFKFEGKKTFKDIIKSCIIIDKELVPLLNVDGTEKTSWDEIDNRGVVIQRARIVRSRPKFNEWVVRFTIEIIDDELISVSTLKEILDYAGGRVGIGDYRPRYGRFMVTKFQEI